MQRNQPALNRILLLLENKLINNRTLDYIALIFRHEIIGVVSRGEDPCGSRPEIYSRISHEAKLWIKSIATSDKESTCS